MKKQIIFFLISLLLLLATACASALQGQATSTTSPRTATSHAPLSSTPQVSGTPTDIWLSLFERTPLPWTTPLPPQIATLLDGTYVKTDPRTATPFPCRRCPDYALEGGIWKLSLREGIFRIYYAGNGWRSMGSFTVSGDRIYLFNDPYCHLETGIYGWALESGTLVFTSIRDPCSSGLRAANLTFQPWLSCHPPSTEAMVTDHWQKPPGCDLTD